MNRVTFPLAVLGGLFAATTLLLAVTMVTAFAAAINTNVAPNPDNSSDYPHVFFMRKDASWGKNTNLELRAYYPSNMTDNDWRNGWLRMRPGGANVNDMWVCQKNDQGMTFAEKNRFVTVTLRSKGVTNAIYHISYDNVCQGGQQDHENREGVDDGNVFFGTYKLPGTYRPTLDEDTQRYIVDIEVAYNSSLPTGSDNLGNTLRFDVQGNSSSGVKIGMKGELRNDDNSNYYSFPIIGDAKSQTSTKPTSTNIPFGLACNIDDTTRARIGLFDADNGGYYWPNTRISFRVKEKGSGDYLRFIDGSERRGNLSEGRTRFTPRDGEKDFASVSANFKPQTNYVMEIDGMVNRNIIDIHVPGDTIFGDVDCAPDARWRIVGSSTANQTEVTRGDTATFTHELENKGVDRSDNVTSSVRWGLRGEITSGTVSGTSATHQYNPKNQSGSTRTWNTSYTIPNTANDGDEYCQYIQWRPTKWDNNSTSNTIDDEACVTVRYEEPPEPTDADVVLRANVNPGGDTETLGSANFSGNINVSNYPTATDGGWGYNSRATEVGATRTTAQMQTYGTSSTSYRTTYTCPTGYSPSNPSSYSYYSCSRTTSSTDCPSGYSPSGSQCYRILTASAYQSGGTWRCPTGYGSFVPPAAGVSCIKLEYVSPTTTTTTSYSYPNALYEYNYLCAQTGNWTGWRTGGSPCNNYYVCPGGTSAGAGWYGSAGSLTCNSWQCIYGAAPYDSQIYVGSRPTCEWRCSGQSGSLPLQAGRRPHLAPNTANKTGTGELRCFVQPSFDLTCYWDNGVSATVRVTGNGNFCNTNTNKPAGAIGQVACAVLTSRRPTAWIPSSPIPGMVHSTSGTTSQTVRWGWTIQSGSSCSNVIGMPYVKVYGGDVRVGGGVAASSGTCTPNETATIRTRNQGPSGYAGSGTQFAAFANGFISQFVSGQYNDIATNPNPGTNPTKLTFANNAGGSGYGGGFDNNGACYDYTQKLPNDTQELSGATVINGRTLGTGEKIVQHVRGNAYITGNITYSGTWATAGQIPLYQLVVEGNIYIDNDVTQLDGVYAAASTGSTTGDIYTCAFVSGASATVPTQTYLNGSSNCTRQLVVNGALSAKKIHFFRDCGSLRWSSTSYPERTQYSGGSDDQLCGSTNHAAEVINFTPEAWIRSSAGTGGSKYDSISSMPPIL